MSTAELSRLIKVRPLPSEAVIIEADAQERANLAKRFGLPQIDKLTAEIMLDLDGSAILAQGKLNAQFAQICSISGDEFPVAIDEPIVLRFVQSRPATENDEDEEIGLSDEDCDEIEYSGDTFDLGEAVAQTLGLSIDPYAEGPNADQIRKEAGISSDDEPSGPLAEALKGLKSI